MADTFRKLGMDVERINDEGVFAAATEAFPEIVDAVLNDGMTLRVLGRTTNDASGRVLFALDEDTTASVAVTRGNLSSSKKLQEGLFTVPIKSLLEIAEAAREKSFSVRILGHASDKKNAACVQVMSVPKGTEFFPQDFWINRVANAPDVGVALLAACDRRS